MATFASASTQLAILKELYFKPEDFMKDLVYRNNPFLTLLPKEESIESAAGKYEHALVA